MNLLCYSSLSSYDTDSSTSHYVLKLPWSTLKYSVWPNLSMVTTGIVTEAQSWDCLGIEDITEHFSWTWPRIRTLKWVYDKKRQLVKDKSKISHGTLLSGSFLYGRLCTKLFTFVIFWKHPLVLWITVFTHLFQQIFIEGPRLDSQDMWGINKLHILFWLLDLVIWEHYQGVENIMNMKKPFYERPLTNFRPLLVKITELARSGC